MISQMPIVRLLDVHKSFGRVIVLDGINLDIHGGSVTCLLGPSGSGKSTLLRTINHLEAVDSGEVWVNGQRAGYRQAADKLYELKPREIARQRENIGMVFQQFNLFPHKTALENVVIGPAIVQRRHASDYRKEGMELLDRVGLADRAGHYPGQLSGGQQQRVAIARALAMRPALMLFDEPTSALDPELVGEVLNVMQDLASSGMTMIVVTHEIGFARHAADTVHFMFDGKLVESGPPSEVLASPDDQRARSFLASVKA